MPLEPQDISDERMAKIIGSALQGVFGREEQGMFINIQRIPLICKDVLQIKEDVSKIEDNLSKGVWIILAAFILGIIALLFK